MRIVGIRCGSDATQIGALSVDGTSVTAIATAERFWTDPFDWMARAPAGPTTPVAQVRVVPPVLDRAKVLCVGLNYLDHVAEGSYADTDLPPHPTVFGRWPSSLAVGGSAVAVPSGEEGLDWEGEVVAWVGAPLVDAGASEASAAVVGYSVFNDLTARRAQKLTSQWTLGKNADGSGVLGPLIPAAEVGDLRAGLRLRTQVNGVTVQDAHTDQMRYPVADTLAFISRTVGLRPGDLLATGTPAGVGYARTPPWLLRPGDVVEVDAERLGSVRNAIVGTGSHHSSYRFR